MKLRNIDGELLSTGCLAEVLNVHRQTIYDWRKSGRLPKPAECEYLPMMVWHGSDILEAHKAGQLTPRR